MVVGVILVALACSLSLVLSAPTKRWSPTVRVQSVILEAPFAHTRAYDGQDRINADLTWGNCTDFGVEDPDPNLSCGYYDVPMDYFDSAAGKARLAVAKYQATVPNKKGTLFVNPGAISMNAGLDAISYVKACRWTRRAWC